VDAEAEVLNADHDLYQRYVLESAVTTAPVTQAAPSPAFEALTQEVQALARTFAPHDPEGLGVLKARVCVAELRKLVLRKKGVAI
jgi:hypothetical protein